MGMGTFRRVAPVLYPFFMISPDKDVAHAHNLFLQTGLDLGIPGLIATISLWIGAFVMLLIVYNRSSEKIIALGMSARPLALGLAGGLLAHGVYGLTDAVALGAKPGFLWWWLLALIAGLFRLQVSGNREQERQEGQVSGSRKYREQEKQNLKPES
jgi:putative inorganic carbon (HCO3(-)) transporter